MIISISFPFTAFCDSGTGIGIRGNIWAANWTQIGMGTGIKI